MNLLQLAAIQESAKRELERRERVQANADLIEASPLAWLEQTFPAYVKGGFSQRHVDFWDWGWSIKANERPLPRVEIWPRGGGKSTSAELLVAMLGARKIRRYCWYVSETQPQADKHVNSISALLDTPEFSEYYPGMADRGVTKYGTSKGWRRDRLVTASGFVIDALGGDVAIRGSRFEDVRPDLIIIDDIDNIRDTPAKTAKKIESITNNILPAGVAGYSAVLVVQNLVLEGGIVWQLWKREADFLLDAQVAGPYPAIEDIEIDLSGPTITGGTPTWEGQNIEVCQAYILTYGVSAFMAECQQKIEPPPGGIYDDIVFESLPAIPADDPIFDTQVWCDPAVSNTQKSDCQAIQVDSIGMSGKLYRLHSDERQDSPQKTIKRAILLGIEYKASHLGIETDQGGDTWISVYNGACAEIAKEKREQWEEGRERAMNNPTYPTLSHTEQQEYLTDLGYDEFVKPIFPKFTSAKAGAGHGGKVERQQRQLTGYETKQIFHVGPTLYKLESALRRFPLEPLDLADASYWSYYMLRAAWIKKFRRKPRGSAAGGKRSNIAKGLLK